MSLEEGNMGFIWAVKMEWSEAFANLKVLPLQLKNTKVELHIKEYFLSIQRL